MEQTVICEFKEGIKVLGRALLFPNDPFTRHGPNIGHESIDFSDPSNRATP